MRETSAAASEYSPPRLHFAKFPFSMAIFHHHLSTISRGASSRGIAHSIHAAVAYAGALRIVGIERTHNWLRKADEIVNAEVIGMRCSPSEFADECEAKEKRWDARVGRSLVVALPRELSDDERWRLAKGYALALRDRYGCASFVAVHRPTAADRSSDNHHAHFVITTRQVVGDELERKIRVLDNAHTAREEVKWMRLEWERRANAILQKHGVPSVSRAAVDKRFANQKLSPFEAAMQRRGKVSRTAQRNRILGKLLRSFSSIERELAELTGADMRSPLKPIVRTFNRKFAKPKAMRKPQRKL